MSRVLAKKLSIVLFVVLIFTGCVTTGRKIDLSAQNKIIVGKSSKADVVKLIGDPSGITNRTDGNSMWVYTYNKSKPNAAAFIPIAGIAFTKTTSKGENVYICFDKNDIVQSISRNNTAFSSSIGFLK